jgi:signal transduction histidine kinase
VVLVFRDFSEHNMAERKLLEINQELDSANRSKEQFFAMLSHELWTPLTPTLANPYTQNNCRFQLKRRLGLDDFSCESTI